MSPATAPLPKPIDCSPLCCFQGVSARLLQSEKKIGVSVWKKSHFAACFKCLSHVVRYICGEVLFLSDPVARERNVVPLEECPAAASTPSPETSPDTPSSPHKHPFCQTSFLFLSSVASVVRPERHLHSERQNFDQYRSKKMLKRRT